MCNQSFADFSKLEIAIHSYISDNEDKLEEDEK
jgi:hypothetical protein